MIKPGICSDCGDIIALKKELARGCCTTCDEDGAEGGIHDRICILDGDPVHGGADRVLTEGRAIPGVRGIEIGIDRFDFRKTRDGYVAYAIRTGDSLDTTPVRGWSLVSMLRQVTRNVLFATIQEGRS